MTENERKVYDWLMAQIIRPHELRVLPPIYRQMKAYAGIDVEYRDFRRAVAFAVIGDPDSTDEQAAAEADVLRKYYKLEVYQ